MQKVYRNEIYFDNAATSRYKPQSVIKAMVAQMRASANPGRGGHRSAIEAGMTVESARSVIESHLGAGAVVWTKNCTEALNQAIFGLNPDGTVIISTFEHNSVYRPLVRLEQQKRIKLKILEGENGLIAPDALNAAIDGDTALIVLCEVGNVIGTRQPVAELSRVAAANGIPMIVDTAQSLGYGLASDYGSVDFVCCSGHKGLHGPQGTGFLWINGNRHTLQPLIYGGTGRDSHSPVQSPEAPEGLESGTLNTPGIAGLAAGAEWSFANLGQNARHIAMLIDFLAEELKKIPGVKLIGRGESVLSFNLGDLGSTETGDRLNEAGISVRAGLHCAPLAHRYLGTLKQGTVRIGAGVENTLKECELLIAAVRRIAASTAI